jgi:hypothetical protein
MSLNRRDISINEGFLPNFHISWKQPKYRLFIYVALSRRYKFVWLLP